MSSIKGITLLLGVFGINIIAPILIGNSSEAKGYFTLIIVAVFMIIVFSVIGTLGLKERVQINQEQKNTDL